MLVIVRNRTLVTPLTWYTKDKLTSNISINKQFSLGHNMSHAKIEISCG